jgi:hypothetical protein
LFLKNNEWLDARAIKKKAGVESAPAFFIGDHVDGDNNGNDEQSAKLS